MCLLLLSKNSKIYHNIDILSNEKHKDNINEEDNRRSLMHRAISSLNSNSMVGLERNVLLVTNHISKTPNGQSNISPDVLFNILTHIRKVNLTILDAYDKKINVQVLITTKISTWLSLIFVMVDIIYVPMLQVSSKL